VIWEKEADAAVKQVPFFVRKKVRQRVETFVTGKGRDRVTLGDVRALKQKFLASGGMEGEIRGYDVSICFGGSGCPNALGDAGGLASDIETVMAEANLLSFLKSQVKGGLKFHHEFRVSISGCPNACSRPQIADIGIIAAAVPGATEAPCSTCESCTAACPDDAVILTGDRPQIEAAACLSCGKCVRACPTGTLETVKTGYRVLLGGRLGRHPRLGMEVPGILSYDGVLDLVRCCLDFYKAHSNGGARFSRILKSSSDILYSKSESPQSARSRSTRPPSLP